MHHPIDLRSDTVTRPTASMREAMARAEVGDDVLGDDPTVRRLEETAARRLGKEAALFTPSGTMANAIAIRAHTQPGDVALMDRWSHSMTYEVGAPAALFGVLTRTFRSDRGVPDAADIEEQLTEETLHTPRTALLVIENTHNRAGGAVIPLEMHRRLYTMARERHVRVHLDGARLFNAAVASGVPASDYAAQTDSVCFCLSKGLGCPVGSLLCGSAEFIERARRVRKQLGGGMRQAGVLAACGLVALETMVDRLADDHRRARSLAHTLAGLPGVTVDLEAVQTNMVYFSTAGPAASWVERLARDGVLCLATGARTIRLVTHADIDDEDVQAAAAALRAAARAEAS